jgi:predicted TIM-barrel fold metal-dependent hydrolase
MPTDLALHIQSLPLCDTHEHLNTEEVYVTQGPDILQSLFDNYVHADLAVAGATPAAIALLMDGGNPDLRARFAAIEPAWQAARHTGYGEAVRIIAREVYGLDEITPAGLEAAQSRYADLRQPGQRLRLLREQANLDHVQIDDFVWPCVPDASGPDFFLYDLSWLHFCAGRPDLAALAQETGITVNGLESLREAMRALFAKYAPVAIAVKAQHAYERTLAWQPRSDEEAAAVLERYLREPDGLSEAERLCLGDWGWARGVELAAEHNLPFKIHTGYYAGFNRPFPEITHARHLYPLLARYPQTRFVLMHIAYPHSDELVAAAKHFTNVYVDLCWAWSIDPYTSADFLRRFLHAVPANKLFVFGGDTRWPSASLAYAHQARAWFTRAMQAEVEAGLLTEPEAIGLATRLMRDNQYACFNVVEKKRTILELASA